MKSDLEEVIEAYELEKKELEQQISFYVEEADYFYAHHHQRALRKINQQLSILKTLQNPSYKSISSHENMLANCKKMLATITMRGLHTGIDYYINRSENEILRLRAIAVQPIQDGQEIDDALFAIADKAASGFKLYFESDQEPYLSFTCANQVIEIKICYDKAPEENYHYMLAKSNKLESLGFSLLNEQWTYHYPFSAFKDALEIKIVLARLIYDLFNFDGSLKTARIVYD